MTAEEHLLLLQIQKTLKAIQAEMSLVLVTLKVRQLL